MGKAYEITVWKPHTGKRGEFIKSMKEVAAIFKENGVSEIVMMGGHAGKDVGHVVVLQTFKNLTDNGIVNDAIADSPAMKAWFEKNKDMDSAVMISHDLYTEEG